jgi:hypothetical protein
MELVLVVHRGAATHMSIDAKSSLRRMRVSQLFSRSYNPQRILRNFPSEGGALIMGDAPAVRVPMHRFWRFLLDPPALWFKSAEAEEKFISTLSDCAVRDIRGRLKFCPLLSKGLKKAWKKSGH